MDKKVNIAIIGCNGHGKSTLRAALIELAELDDSVEVDEVNVGAIGHVDNQMTVEIKMRDEEPAASDYGFDFRKRNKSDRKRNRANRWR